MRLSTSQAKFCFSFHPSNLVALTACNQESSSLYAFIRKYFKLRGESYGSIHFQENKTIRFGHHIEVTRQNNEKINIVAMK